MKKTFFFMSLLFGLVLSTFALVACNSGNDDDNNSPQDFYATYDINDFMQFIESQYANSDKSILVIECDDYNNTQIYADHILAGGLVFLEDKNGNYSIEGYSYYNFNGAVKQNKEFSIPIEDTGFTNFIQDAFTFYHENIEGYGKAGQYTICMSHFSDSGIYVSTGENRLVYIDSFTLRSFITSCNEILTADYPNLIIGKWEEMGYGEVKYYEFAPNGTVIVGTGYVTSDNASYRGTAYKYKLNNEKITIYTSDFIYDIIDQKVISRLNEDKLDLMDDYAIGSWNKRTSLQKVNK